MNLLIFFRFDLSNSLTRYHAFSLTLSRFFQYSNPITYSSTVQYRPDHSTLSMHISPTTQPMVRCPTC